MFTTTTTEKRKDNTKLCSGCLVKNAIIKQKSKKRALFNEKQGLFHRSDSAISQGYFHKAVKQKIWLYKIIC